MIGLVSAKIFHARLRPKPNSFRYGATYLAVPLGELFSHRSGLFSIDRVNLFGLKRADYGEGGEPEKWIANVLAGWGVPQADGEIVLVTMPRVLGYAFNPVNFWLCHDAKGGLRAVLAEVNNTFGERHCYLCFHTDRRAIAPTDVLTARKIFHVSPFIETKGDYCFRFSLGKDRLAIQIDLSDEDGLLLRTSISGGMRPLTSAALLRTLLANPLMPFKVIGLIHYQALKLLLKRIRHISKPKPPAISISN
ncbi:MAG TPA: DUF1365 domain-containing protein [Rhizomicrobium sp.]|nr:DUF1365 domain-containing protein [Rhizomicrobium sp.]